MKKEMNANLQINEKVWFKINYFPLKRYMRSL